LSKSSKRWKTGYLRLADATCSSWEALLCLIYVGQACKSFLVKEALNASNRGKYNEVLSEKNGRPFLFFVPMRTPTGRLRRSKTGAGRLATIDFLEEWLIATALRKNPNLMNNRKTRFLRSVHVTGVFNAKHGEATKAAQLLRKGLGLQA
jgi:hypothetical protein